MNKTLQQIDKDRKYNPIIIIPARIGSTRLKGKLLEKIAGKPMIWHVWSRAIKSSIGKVVVATDSSSILETIESAGGEAFLTKKDHLSGSDRIYEALENLDSEEKFDIVVNLQGDLPDIHPSVISNLFYSIGSEDITTLVKVAKKNEIFDTSVVKVAIAWENSKNKFKVGNGLYFSRAPIPYNSNDFWHHIGIYAWKRKSLKRFIQLPKSLLEEAESLEQLRALEAGMKIKVIETKFSPTGVDTQKDLNRVREIMKKENINY